MDMKMLTTLLGIIRENLFNIDCNEENESFVYLIACIEETCSVHSNIFCSMKEQSSSATIVNGCSSLYGGTM